MTHVLVGLLVAVVILAPGLALWVLRAHTRRYIRDRAQQNYRCPTCGSILRPWEYDLVASDHAWIGCPLAGYRVHLIGDPDRFPV